MKRANKKPRLCDVEGCGRPARARGLCQTHYKHMRKHGETRPINPKRQGREGTMRYAGLSLTRECAAAIDEVARAEVLAPNAVITDIIEAWAKRHLGARARNGRGGGAAGKRRKPGPRKK